MPSGTYVRAARGNMSVGPDALWLGVGVRVMVTWSVGSEDEASQLHIILVDMILFAGCPRFEPHPVWQKQTHGDHLI